MTERRSSRGDDRDDDRGRGRDRDDRGRDSGRGRDDDRDSRGGRDRDDRGGRDRDRGRDDDRGGRSGGSSYQYQRRTSEQAAKRANQGGKDFDNILSDKVANIFNPGEDDHSIRPLPPTWDGAEHYGIDVYIHYGVGPDQQKYLCLDKMKGQPCPICEERAQARRDGEDDDYIKSMEPTKRVAFYLIDRQNERDGVQAWLAPWTADRDITTICVDKRSGDVLPIDDPENGYDVDFKVTGTGMKKKYTGWAIARRESPLGKSAWLEFAQEHPLPDQLTYYDYDHIKKAFAGGGAHNTRADRDDRGRDDDRGGRDRGGRGDRDEDRGSDRGGRDRDDDRSRDRGRGSDRDERTERGGRSSREPEHTWASVHALSTRELDDLVASEKLPLNPDKFDSDELLADAICEELNLKEEKEERGGRGGDRDRDSSSRERREPAGRDDEGGDKLRQMRENRGR